MISVGWRWSVDPNFEKHHAFDRAKDLLARNDEDSIRYAALEFRRCLEAVVYEKLWIYRRRIPAEAARKWQPPQAFKALLLMEPDADETFTVAVRPEKAPGVISDEPWTTLGTDVRPKAPWLTKTWNKLGSFLHATWPFERPHELNHEDRIMELRAFLEKTTSELEPFVRQDVTFTASIEITFTCSVCGFEIRVNARGIEHAGEITCIECDCRYLVEKVGQDLTFRLDAAGALCPECSEQFPLPRQKLKEGYEFSCPACSCEFVVTAPAWEFRKKIDASPA